MTRKLGIREVFSFPVEMEVYVDEHEIELYLIPVEGSSEPGDFRLIIDRRLLQFMAIDPDTFIREIIEDRGKFRVILDNYSMKFEVREKALPGECSHEV